MKMSCTRNRRIFWIAFSLLALAAIGGLSYYIWYVTYYIYNIADHVRTIRFSESNYKVTVIWRRKDWQCTAEIYQGSDLLHEIDLGTWFAADEKDNYVWLTSGSGPGMRISVHEDSSNSATIEFDAIGGMNHGYTYFNLNNLHWFCEAENDISGILTFATGIMIRHRVDRFYDFQCRNPSPASTDNSVALSS